MMYYYYLPQISTDNHNVVNDIVYPEILRVILIMRVTIASSIKYDYSSDETRLFEELMKFDL